MKTSLFPAVFLDRDGVITEKIKSDAPQKVSDLKIIPEIIPVINKLQERGYKIIVTSNQPDVALGNISEEIKEKLKKHFEELLKKNKLAVDGIYYCFHHTKGVIKKYTKDCSCHKPKPGMLLKAAKDLSLDLTKSYIIGDRASDIVAGSKVGVTTILFDPEDNQEKYLTLHNIKPDFTIKSVADALKIIL